MQERVAVCGCVDELRQHGKDNMTTSKHDRQTIKTVRLHLCHITHVALARNCNATETTATTTTNLIASLNAFEDTIQFLIDQY